MEQFERKSLFKLTYPLFLYSALSIAVTFVDQILLSNYSENLAAAVSLANQILGVAYDVSGLFAVGALVIMSQYLGRNEVEKAKSVAIASIQASFLLCLLIAAVLMIGASYFADMVGAPSEIRSDVIIYVHIIALAMIFNGAIVSCTAALRGFGHTLSIFVLGILANVLYLVLEYGLIYGKFGFPELGVYGAALSTLIVRIGMIGFLLFVLSYYVKINIFQRVSDFLPSLKKITKLSYPSVGEGMAYNIYQLVMVSLISVLGTGAVLVRSYSLTIGSLLSTIHYVIAQGNEILIGYDCGAKDSEAAYRRAIKTSLITAGVSVVLSIVLYVFSDTLVGLFTDQLDIKAGVSDILFVAIFIAPMNAINQIFFTSLKATGDVNRPVLWNLSLTFALALPLGFLFVRHFELGVVGLWYVYLIEETVKAGVLSVLWFRKNWIRYFPLDSAN
ncbi:MAG: MATE family efflux transporter [Pseudobacteriovorax sp.]|nr:MATE family efflux transporter [Pseudobacteriovorax sp.]